MENLSKKPIGSIEATSFGNVVTTSSGGTSVSMPIINRIDLCNIIDVTSYNISHNNEEIRHSLVFKDGAQGVIAYTPEGKMLEFSFSKGGAFAISKDGVVTIGMNGAPLGG